MEQELWKDVVGCEGRYQVSNYGRIMSTVMTHNYNPYYLKPHVKRKGYLAISMWQGNNRSKLVAVHRIVAKAWIPNPDNLPQVNHIDGDKANNNVSNLEWCTNIYNAHHAMKNGLFYKGLGETSNQHKLTVQQVIEIKTLLRDKKNTERGIAKLFGVSRGCITYIKWGKTWKEVII